MDKNNYLKKMQEMMGKGIQDGVFAKTEDHILEDLKLFQGFLYRNFSKYEKYNDILPSSNQPVQLYGTAKTNTFDDINDITVESLKLRLIIAQAGTYIYKPTKSLQNI